MLEFYAHAFVKIGRGLESLRGMVDSHPDSESVLHEVDAVTLRDELANLIQWCGSTQPRFCQLTIADILKKINAPEITYHKVSVWVPEILSRFFQIF